MYSYTIGFLLATERTKKGISLRKLSDGICSYQMLDKIEKDKCDGDKLLFDILLQRLGKCPDRLECILSQEEFKKIRIRNFIEESILHDKTQRAETLLEKYYEMMKSSGNVSKMYYFRTKAYICLHGKNDIEEAYKNIKSALRCTLPEGQRQEMGSYLISTYEMENLLLLGKILFLQGKIQEAEILVRKCLKYMKEHPIDEEEKAKIFPKCVWVLTQINKEKENHQEIIFLCEEAIAMLRKWAITYFMLPLMQELVLRYEQIGNTEKRNYWKRYEEILQKLYQTYAPNMCLKFLFYNCFQCEYHLDYEMVQSERNQRHINQERFIEDVYGEPKSIYNLEHKKSSPSKQKFEMLMDKINLEKRRYNSFVATNSYDVLAIRENINRAFSRHDVEEVSNCIHQLREKLDTTYRENIRLIETYEIDLLVKTRVLSPKEARKRLTLLLEETYPIDTMTNYRAPLNSESMIINGIGISLWKEKKLEEGILLYEKTLKNYRRSKVSCKYHCKQYELLLGNYIAFRGEAGQTRHLEKIVSQGVSFILQCGKGNLLGLYFREMANALCQDMQIEKAVETFQFAVRMAELFHNEYDARVARDMVETTLGEEFLKYL